jgi:hypothetical protein
MVAQNQDAQVNSPSVSLIRYLGFQLYLKSLFRSSNSAHPKPTWCAASTAAAPPTRQRRAAPTRAGGNDRRFLFFASTFDLFLVLTIIFFSD